MLTFAIVMFCLVVNLVSVTPKRKNIIEDINIRYYNGVNVKTYVKFVLSNFTTILSLKTLKVNQRTVMYIHGQDENGNSKSVKTIVGVYLQYLTDYSIIVLDWGNMAHGSENNDAALNTDKIGSAVGHYLLDIFAKEIRSNQFHIVAYSLGCHVAASIGRKTKLSGVTISRITGLDCMFPFLYPSFSGRRLNSESADFVDIIHTDSRGFGDFLSVGHVDFWPNGGIRVQPGCQDTGILDTFSSSTADVCSHKRSWVYYAESIRNPTAFIAVQCADYNTFKKNKCFNNIQTNMGFAASRSARSDFYLKTNITSPFGLGIVGIQPNK